MNEWPIKKTALWVVAALGIGFLILLIASESKAADLGGNCCADLEERIAELEATTARKGNRKVTLRVYGQVNKALLHVSEDGNSDFAVIENSSAETFVGFAGEGRIGKDWKGGYVLEIGAGGQKTDKYGLFGSPDDSNEIFVRQSYVYVDGPAGKGSIGLANQATDGVAEITVANTAVAARMLSLRPLNGPQAGDALDVFDGTRANLLRYDSPVLAGFMVSASWANGDEFGPVKGDVWDVALRYAGEFGGFRVGAGVGYRNGVAVPSAAEIGSAYGEDIRVTSGSVSVKHIDSGLFVNAAAGKLDLGAFGDDKAYHVQAGIERKWSELGATTIFAEYAHATVDPSLASFMSGFGVYTVDKGYGGGIVQHFDGAALDLYGTVRRLEAGDDDATLIMGGARVLF